MSTADDEAFIRAIVAAPADDAPRLVYADWLDERGDPRGQYLRREVTVFRNPAEGYALEWVLEPLARSVQLSIPVWIARVSRPPLGVCCDQMTLAESKPRLKRPTLIPEVIDRVEGRFGISFGPEYRAFLLNYNGGLPKPASFQLSDGSWIWRCSLHSIWSEYGLALYDEHDLVHQLEKKQNNSRWSDPDVEGLLEIGYADGHREWLCLDCDEESSGRIFLVDLSLAMEEPVLHVASSLPEFLALFQKPPDDEAV